MNVQDRYLGDGVYAHFDGYAIHLDLRAQDLTTTVIVLEPEVLRALDEYREHVRRQWDLENVWRKPPIGDTEAEAALEPRVAREKGSQLGASVNPVDDALGALMQQCMDGHRLPQPNLAWVEAKIGVIRSALRRAPAQKHDPDKVRAAWEAWDWFVRAPVAMTEAVREKFAVLAAILPPREEEKKP